MMVSPIILLESYKKRIRIFLKEKTFVFQII